MADSGRHPRRRRETLRNGILMGTGVGAAVASLPLVIGNECRYETCGSQLGFPIAGAIKGWTTIFAVAPRASATPRKGSVIVRAAFVW